MNDILKQRLIGALILVALGVVFWPIIFVQPDTATGSPVQMPPRPEVDTTPVAAPDRAGLRGSPQLDALIPDSEPGDSNDPVVTGTESLAVQDPQTADANALVANSPTNGAVAPGGKAVVAPGASTSGTTDKPTPTRTQAPAEQKLDAQGVPIAWILQVASVSSQDKANQLRDRLQAMGHKAYVKQVQVNDRQLQRVYIGPKFERARLESLQREIDAEFRVKSMIKRYLP